MASTVGFAGRGEMIPNDDTYWKSIRASSTSSASRCCASTSSSRDHEMKQAKHMQETFREIIHEMGGTPLSTMPTEAQNYGLAAGGRIIHEVGRRRGWATIRARRS